MSFQLASKALAWAVLICALGFAAYLVPGPQMAADRLMSSDDAQHIQPQQDRNGTSATLTEQERAGISALTRRAWVVNLLLFVLGTTAGAVWLWGGRKGWRHRLPIICLLAVILIYFALVIPANSDNFAAWLPDKIAFIKRLSSIGAWTYVAAEVHRIANLAIVVASVICFSLKSSRRAN